MAPTLRSATACHAPQAATPRSPSASRRSPFHPSHLGPARALVASLAWCRGHGDLRRWRGRRFAADGAQRAGDALARAIRQAHRGRGHARAAARAHPASSGGGGLAAAGTFRGGLGRVGGRGGERGTRRKARRRARRQQRSRPAGVGAAGDREWRRAGGQRRRAAAGHLAQPSGLTVRGARGGHGCRWYCGGGRGRRQQRSWQG